MKALFDVASYVDIPKVRYEEALTLILNGSLTWNYKQELIWLMETEEELDVNKRISLTYPQLKVVSTMIAFDSYHS